MKITEVFDRYGVEYVTQGPNVKRGNINIACPFCGDDPSHHLGIDPETNAWGCWRNREHRGRRIAWLVAKLLHLGLAEAQALVGESARTVLETGDYERAVLGLSGISAVAQSQRSTADIASRALLALPHSFYPLDRGSYAARRGVRYVRGRGFPGVHCKWAAARYRLHFAPYGEFKNRVIFPVYEHGQLMTWVGRHTSPNAELRYRALEKEKSVREVKDLVYNIDRARKEWPRVVFICEGPFDAIKLDYYAADGAVAVALFNMDATPRQIDLLSSLARRADQFVVVLDRGETGAAVRLTGVLEPYLRGRKISIADVGTYRVKDPGEMTGKQVLQFTQEWIK